MEVHCKINADGLAAGILAASKYTKRTLPQLVDTSAYWIAVNAKAGMPFVTPDKIDSELGVLVQPKIGRRGKPLSQKFSKNKVFKSTRLGDSTPVPLGALIVAARADPMSYYNRSTAGRYALSKNPFKGVSREAGRAAMAALVDKMIKTRHRGAKFLVAGWIPAIKDLSAYAVNKFIRGGPKPSDGAKSYYGANLGGAVPSVADKWDAQAIISNNVGGDGQNRASFNQALLKYGTGPLQDAVNREGKKQMEYALKKMGKELEDSANKHWS